MLGAGEALTLLVILVPPLAVLAAVQAWTVWLVRRSKAPRLAIWVLPAFVAIFVVGTGAVLVTVFRSVGHVAPADRATILAASLSEAANSAAVCFPVPFVWIGVLAYFSARKARP